jgi:hypothetical protein
VSGNSIQATGAVAHAEFVLHFGLLSHDCNCRLARADPAHPVRIFRADLDFLLDVVDVATREGGVDDQSGCHCAVVNEGVYRGWVKSANKYWDSKSAPGRAMS